ncbi:hypothetical protein J2045_003377 [Peteryoungia aggregata LMG 23059]|uniref:Uncharacterized protein n=1 Tax=Peteryoungia aggregata LMG 23059 TaxID=1368425 RepID=A0ABU0GAE5_9HYPH|nr:hypothetical protein [Peteryoungia aggregata]MDQ0422329.1 hypothetical protein [Peteryoungia aggregata LMG 23059]
MPRKKRVTMLVTVSVPEHLSAAEARREVRTLINEQCLYSSELDDGDIKAVRVTPAPREA